jgi:hypothetical protein
MNTRRHVLGISGGKDSAALAIFMRQSQPHIPITYFFTDTGKELPEVYEFLGSLEGFLGQPIVRLNPDRDFDFWLTEYGHFLPSVQTRWCTRQLKLRPFHHWIAPWLKAGDEVHSYVAIRADESAREGMASTHNNLRIHFPFREFGIDRAGVEELLESSGVGKPKYYQWRSRSGCTFCFFQQKIEWVRLKHRHPNFFEEAKRYEKAALEHQSPFTWSSGESLEEIEETERMVNIVREYLTRQARERKAKASNPNPLRPLPNPIAADDAVDPRQYLQALARGADSGEDDIDELYLEEEGGGACLVCHK